MAAIDQYFEGAVPQTECLEEDKCCSEKWKSAADSIADSDRNGCNSFDCNICLDCVQDPVVTLCGHLYCWPCIYKWLHFSVSSSEEENNEQQNTQCPVCKADISQSSLVPLYGRGQATRPLKGKSHQVGLVIPRRPHGPSWVVDPPRSSNATTHMASPPASQFYHRHYPYYPLQFNSISGGYSSPMLSMDGALRNAFDTSIGDFGEMVYARMFGNQVTNIYTYPNTYNLAGNSNPRIRRHLMQADKQLNRICFFLLCCFVLCLLLF